MSELKEPKMLDNKMSSFLSVTQIDSRHVKQAENGGDHAYTQLNPKLKRKVSQPSILAREQPVPQTKANNLLQLGIVNSPQARADPEREPVMSFNNCSVTIINNNHFYSQQAKSKQP